MFLIFIAQLTIAIYENHKHSIESKQIFLQNIFFYAQGLRFELHLFFILHKIRYNQQIFINHSNITRSLAHFVDTRVRLLKEKLIP